MKCSDLIDTVFVANLKLKQFNFRSSNMEAQRIKAIEPPYDKSIQEDFDKIMPPGIPPLNLFKTVANNPRVLHRMIIGGLLDKGSISIQDRELMILRTCGRCGAEYEWGVHVAVFAEKAKLDRQQIEDTVSISPEISLWNTRQQLILALADELFETKTCSSSLWKKLTKEFAADQIIELIALSGLYHGVSFLVNALNLDQEPFAPSFSS